jgi:glutamate synthase (NADPH/NADH) small chain
MGSDTGFLDFKRNDRRYLTVEERKRNYREFTLPLTRKEIAKQGARCIDCGIPYCHFGCPVNNIIPDFNDLIYRDDWKTASDVLHSTNNFPEFTGRVCPAPCEEACTLNLHDAPVTIKSIEHSIVERAWGEGWIRPQIPRRKTGKKIAIVGSGPAGMAAAQQLARVGHRVIVFEKNSKVGGLLRYGIPDFKLEKHILDRRMAQMQAEGVDFHVNCHVGHNVSMERLIDEYDSVILAGGAEYPRDIDVPGRELRGVGFALPFLEQQNRRLGGEPLRGELVITAKDKRVVVIGGGDTGSDCIGTSNRQGARSITQLELLPMPPEKPDKLLTWPEWPDKLRTSTSHEEGCERQWSILTKSFSGSNGQVDTLNAVKVDWKNVDGQWQMTEIKGSEFSIPADLVLIAAGFVHPVHHGLLEKLGVDLDDKGNVSANTDDYTTSISGVFAAGDIRRGQSLVVWAIREGRQVARAVDKALMGTTKLPR